MLHVWPKKDALDRNGIKLHRRRVAAVLTLLVGGYDWVVTLSLG